MNFYDKVYELVKVLKDTQEYKNYVDIKKELKKDNAMVLKLKSFKENQKVLQMEYINNGKPDAEKQKELENEYSILIQNENVRNFFEAEIRLDVLLADMQKIIADGIKEVIDFD